MLNESSLTTCEYQDTNLTFRDDKLTVRKTNPGYKSALSTMRDG